MTTTTTAPAPALGAVAPRTDLRVTWARVVRSEWIKFWSLRSSVITLAVAALVFVGIGLLAASFADSGAPPGAPDAGDMSTNPVDLSLAGSGFAQLILAMLGVLFMATEYTTGMIRSTLAAVPTRLPVLWAKAAVFAGVSFVVMVIAASIAFLGGQAIIGDGGASLTDDGVLRAIVGTAGYVTGAGLIGLALGALLRSTAAAAGTVFAVMFLLDGLSSILLPDSWQDTVTPYLPSRAGSAIGAVTQAANSLSPGEGLLVFAGYLVLLGGAAAWRLKKHDA